MLVLGLGATAPVCLVRRKLRRARGSGAHSACQSACPRSQARACPPRSRGWKTLQAALREKNKAAAAAAAEGPTSAPPVFNPVHQASGGDPADGARVASDNDGPGTSKGARAASAAAGVALAGVVAGEGVVDESGVGEDPAPGGGDGSDGDYDEDDVDWEDGDGQGADGVVVGSKGRGDPWPEELFEGQIAVATSVGYRRWVLRAWRVAREQIICRIVSQIIRSGHSFSKFGITRRNASMSNLLKLRLV